MTTHKKYPCPMSHTQAKDLNPSLLTSPPSEPPVKTSLQKLPKELLILILEALYDKRVLSLFYFDYMKSETSLNWHGAMKADKSLVRASQVCHSLKDAADSVLGDHSRVVARARAEDLKRRRGWCYDDQDRMILNRTNKLFDFLEEAEQQQGETLMLDGHQLFLVHEDLAREVKDVWPFRFWWS